MTDPHDPPKEKPEKPEPKPDPRPEPKAPRERVNREQQTEQKRFAERYPDYLQEESVCMDTSVTPQLQSVTIGAGGSVSGAGKQGFDVQPGEYQDFFRAVISVNAERFGLAPGETLDDNTIEQKLSNIQAGETLNMPTNWRDMMAAAKGEQVITPNDKAMQQIEEKANDALSTEWHAIPHERKTGFTVKELWNGPREVTDEILQELAKDGEVTLSIRQPLSSERADAYRQQLKDAVESNGKTADATTITPKSERMETISFDGCNVEEVAKKIADITSDIDPENITVMDARATQNKGTPSNER